MSKAGPHTIMSKGLPKRTEGILYVDERIYESIAQLKHGSSARYNCRIVKLYKRRCYDLDILEDAPVATQSSSPLGDSRTKC